MVLTRPRVRLQPHRVDPEEPSNEPYGDEWTLLPAADLRGRLQLLIASIWGGEIPARTVRAQSTMWDTEAGRDFRRGCLLTVHEDGGGRWWPRTSGDHPDATPAELSPAEVHSLLIDRTGFGPLRPPVARWSTDRVLWPGDPRGAGPRWCWSRGARPVPARRGRSPPQLRVRRRPEDSEMRRLRATIGERRAGPGVGEPQPWNLLRISALEALIDQLRGPAPGRVASAPSTWPRGAERGTALRSCAASSQPPMW